jgi:ferredoxin--NADP+ reductase/benzoate/toluate 1,2-dioxygenase reductase subunit
MESAPQIRQNSEPFHLSKAYRLQLIRQLTPEAFVLRFDRNGMSFRAGQHITLGVPGNNQLREYSIYSTERDPFLEVLVKEIENGLVSRQLRKLNPGDLLDADGPFGYFTIPEQHKYKSFLFIGTGTGIAPFHSIAGTYPNLDYAILHGVRYTRDAYERHHYPRNKYLLCSSRDTEGDFHGRVTDYLSQMTLHSGTMVYLCGNCDMIYEVYDLLTSKGFPSGNIRTEVYF